MKKETVILKKERGNFSLDFIWFFILIFVIFLYLVIKLNFFKGFDFLKEITAPYSEFFNGFLIVIIIFISTHLFIRFTKKILKKYFTNVGRGKQNIKFFLIIYEYLIWITILVLTFSIVLKQGASLITSVGLIGFGLTLALQKPILNFVGWLTIIFGKTYHLGDVILIQGVVGEVYDIRVMYTHLSELNSEGDPTGRAVFIPNEFVFSQPITNYTKGTPVIWDSITIPLTYASNWKKVLKIAKETVQNYYDKNIKEYIQHTFKDSFDGYDKVVVRLNMHEKGISIKARYLVDFSNANDVKNKLTEILLNKLKSKDILLGKVESVV